VFESAGTGFGGWLRPGEVRSSEDLGKTELETAGVVAKGVLGPLEALAADGQADGTAVEIDGRVVEGRTLYEPRGPESGMLAEVGDGVRFVEGIAGAGELDTIPGALEPGTIAMSACGAGETTVDTGDRLPQELQPEPMEP
jgi:hypothetical protein